MPARHELIPQVKELDCKLRDLTPSTRFKATVYVYGQVVKEIYDFCTSELRKQLRAILLELDAPSHLPLSQTMQWAIQQAPCGGADPVIQIQASARKRLVFHGP
jgi:hypothetical protein